MKLISWNIRGLGGKVKKGEIKVLVNLEKPDFLCVQETKMENVELRLCRFFWNDFNFSWAFKPSAGRSGGLLSMWNASIF